MLIVPTMLISRLVRWRRLNWVKYERENDIYAIRDSLLDWLKEHRHGVMGTVIFICACYLFGLCRISRLIRNRGWKSRLICRNRKSFSKSKRSKKKEQILQQSADEEWTRCCVRWRWTRCREEKCWNPASRTSRRVYWTDSGGDW